MSSAVRIWKGTNTVMQVLWVEAGWRRLAVVIFRDQSCERVGFDWHAVRGYENSNASSSVWVLTCNRPGTHGHAAKPLNDL